MIKILENEQPINNILYTLYLKYILGKLEHFEGKSPESSESSESPEESNYIDQIINKQKEYVDNEEFIKLPLFINKRKCVNNSFDIPVLIYPTITKSDKTDERDIILDNSFINCLKFLQFTGNNYFFGKRIDSYKYFKQFNNLDDYPNRGEIFKKIYNSDIDYLYFLNTKR